MWGDMCRCSRWVFAWCLLLALFYNCLGAPARKKDFIDDNVHNYLMQFGYLPQSDIETGNLRTEESVRDAIRDLQRFGGLPPTGEVDAATRRLLSTPRCGVPDKQEPQYMERPGYGIRRVKRYTLQGLKWGYTNLTWSLRKKPSRRDSRVLDTGRVRAALARALDVWAQHSKLTFQELDSDDADILVSFEDRYHGDGYPFDGKGQILAHAFFPNTGRGGDAHFDDAETWLTEDYDDNEEGTSLFLVAAHEFGHSLGLSHSSVEGALMYPWYQGLKQDFQLPDDDRHGIQQMYGARETKMWDRRPVYNPPPTTARTTERTTTRPRYPHYYPEKPYYPDKKHQYPKEHPHYPHKGHHDDREWGQDHPRRHPEKPTRHPDHRYPDNTPRRHPEEPRRYPEEPRRYPENNDPKRYDPRYPANTPRRFPETNDPRRYPETTDPRRYPDTNDPRRYPGYDHPERRPTTERPRHREHLTRKPETKPVIPETCDTSYDAISVIRREVFIFKDKYLWRIGDHGLKQNYPVEIVRMWNGLPENLTQVDAVYERPDNKIVFFVGKKYYVHNGNNVERGYPKPLSHLGLPESLEKMDAAMIWGHNSKTYFYSGTMYWRFDEELGKVELDYPRDMSMWKGVGYNIDTVFQWKDGKTYFFKGKGFWKFNDLKMSVEKPEQSLSAPFWMGCPGSNEGKEIFTKEKYTSEETSSANIHLSSMLTLSLILFIRLWILVT